jgi:aerobic-type carbon monoxide dehydrogenase small subunit (CoxS/CutS family)
VKRVVTFRLNGADEEVVIEPHHTLLDVLRREFKLFGAREACGIGTCGSCTVLMDGKPVSSCLVLGALAADGQSIVTIEGLAANGTLHPVQQSFIDHTAFQCSYCTPGFILTVVALLEESPSPTVREIQEYLAGNLCRCGSYVKIQEAVVDVASKLHRGAHAP